MLGRLGQVQTASVPADVEWTLENPVRPALIGKWPAIAPSMMHVLVTRLHEFKHVQYQMVCMIDKSRWSREAFGRWAAELLLETRAFASANEFQGKSEVAVL